MDRKSKLDFQSNSKHDDAKINNKEIKIVYDPLKSKSSNVAMQNLRSADHDDAHHKSSSDSLAADSFFNPSNYILSEVYINDDLSQLPSVDEKSIVTCIKNKFENHKYYVTNIYSIVRGS